MDRETAVAFARGNPTHEAPTGELRQDTPRWILDVLDGLAMGEGHRSRVLLVNRILEQYVVAERHKHSIVARVLGIKAAGADGAGGLSA